VASGGCVFVTDAGGRVVSIDTSVSFTKLFTNVNTGTGVLRADELAYDPKDGVLLVINNADTPPFGTLITVNKSTCSLITLPGPVGTRITFNAANHVNATAGAEQPVWEPMTQRFYVSIPEINGPGDNSGPNGGVARINPLTGAIEAVYPVNFCEPAGLTVGPNGDLLVGCMKVFDTSGNVCSAVVPAPSAPGTPAAHPATCTGIGFPQEAICNPTPGRDCKGNALVSVPGVGGGDEVWYNSGDGNYYVTAGNNPLGPTFGVVGSVVNTLSQLVPTLPSVPAVGTAGTASFVHSAGTVHSIAASATNNHVYVPLPANTSYPNCAQGCIAVYGVQ
jgi:hypothetical protein